MTDRRTETLDVAGARLHYDIRNAEPASDEPPLLMIGLPMGADGFAALADRFRERTVVTYDPRGVGRSERTNGARESNPDEHADDLHRLIGALGGGPVDIFASSGGAVVALALVARHPGDMRTLVAHEPPAAPLLPDRDQALAAIGAIRDTYEREGFGPAMARFIALAGVKGPFPDDFKDQPPPPPSAFGLPAEDDGSRDDALLKQNLIGTTHYEHDLDAVRAAPTRVIVGVGTESEGEMAYRAAVVVAERLGTEPVVFPGHHGGFLGEGSGYAGDPDGFAAVLRDVLAGRR